ncbi:3-oxoacyl-ACP synthase [Candidatus Fermentibacteria bacterium]|nr:MAG: 3-oxoacyl-ACP synthase [Candidatus Fermentibacteria bacterium]
MSDRKAYIKGTGHFAPEQTLTNADLEKMVDTSDEWITSRTGISQRHIAPDDMANSDMSCEAGKRALEDAGWAPEDVQAVILGTVTPDYSFPNTAALVADKLGVGKVPCYDFEAGCSGFIYGLIQAKAFIESGMLERVLVIGAEKLSSLVNWEDRNTCVLFGDGAGAACVGSEGPGGLLGGIHWGADGSLGYLLELPASGSRMPVSHEALDKKLNTIHMSGGEVMKNAVRAMRDSALKSLAEEGLTYEDVNLLISHQANVRIIESTARVLRLKWEDVYVNIDRYGNTSSASIPIALDEALHNGTIKPGYVVVLAAFGAGLTWGGMVVRWSDE